MENHLCHSLTLIRNLRLLGLLVVALLLAFRRGGCGDLQKGLDTRTVRVSHLNECFVAKVLQISFALFPLAFSEQCLTNAIVVESRRRSWRRSTVDAKDLKTLSHPNRIGNATNGNVLQRCHQIFTQIGNVKLANVAFILWRGALTVLFTFRIRGCECAEVGAGANLR